MSRLCRGGRQMGLTRNVTEGLGGCWFWIGDGGGAGGYSIVGECSIAS